MSPKKTKRAGKTSAQTSGTLVVQAHGGALRVGGKPGNIGGLGRPSSAIRALCSLAFEERIPILKQIADGEAIQKQIIEGVETETLVSADVNDRLKAIDALGKYGPGAVKEVSVDSVRERVAKTLDTIQRHVSPEQYAAIVQDIHPVWS